MTLGLEVRNIIELLEEFGSEEHQRRHWINAEDPSVVSFFAESIECVSSREIASTVNWMLDRGLVSEIDAASVKRFLDLLDAFLDEIERAEIDVYENARIVAHPSWPRVMEAANRAIPVLIPFRDSPLILYE